MLSHKLAVHTKGVISGSGLVAIEEITTGELLWEADPDAPVVTLAEWQALPRDAESRHRFSQISTDEYVLNPGDEYSWNHSCDPNCVCVGPRMYALERIGPGQEATYDYALNEVGRQYRMARACGAPTCRGAVTIRDYLLREVQRRHAGWIPAYVQAAIDAAGPWDKLYCEARRLRSRLTAKVGSWAVHSTRRRER